MASADWSPQLQGMDVDGEGVSPMVCSVGEEKQ